MSFIAKSMLRNVSKLLVWCFVSSRDAGCDYVMFVNFAFRFPSWWKWRKSVAFEEICSIPVIEFINTYHFIHGNYFVHAITNSSRSECCPSSAAGTGIQRNSCRQSRLQGHQTRWLQRKISGAVLLPSWFVRFAINYISFAFYYCLFQF